jgi:hypothetical protein
VVGVPPRARQLIIGLTGDPGAQLLVSAARPVSISFSPAPDFAAKSFVASKNIYLGPQSNPPLTEGSYFISVANCTRSATSFALQATLVMTEDPTGSEELAVDDGTQESGLVGDGAVLVNRLTPTRYPSTLKSIRLYFTQFPAESDPFGSPIRLLAFADSIGSGRPPNSPNFLLDRIATIAGDDEFLDFSIEDGPTIYSGDWYVGFQAPSPANGVIVTADSSGPQRQASFFSNDAGVTFLGPAFNPSQLFNFMIRAVVDNTKGPRPRRRP